MQSLSGATSNTRAGVLILGASAGIGLAIAREYAVRGHPVFLIARDAARLASAENEIKIKFDVATASRSLDIAAPDAPDAIRTIVETSPFPIHHVVSCAGSWAFGPLAGSQPEAISEILNRNCVAHLLVANALLPTLPATTGASYLFVGSLAGMVPMPGMSAYAAAKSSLQSAVLGLRGELQGSAIKISLLCPGAVLTNFINRDPSAWRTEVLDLVSSTPETVARAGYLGVMSNRPVIVPGLVWRLLYLLMQIAPERVSTWVVGLFLSRANKQQDEPELQRLKPSLELATIPLLAPGMERARMSRVSRIRENATSLIQVMVMLCVVLTGVLAYTAFKSSHSSARSTDIAAQRSALLATGHWQTPAGPPLLIDRPPGYGIALAPFAMASPTARAQMFCNVAHRAACESGPVTAVIAAQIVAAFAIVGLTFVLSHLLSGSSAIAAIATVLTIISTRLGSQAGTLWPAIFYHLSFLIFISLLVVGWRRQSSKAIMGSGCMLGTCALFEPLAGLLVPVTGALLCDTSLHEHKRSASRCVLHGAVFILGAVAAIGGLMAIGHPVEVDPRSSFFHLATQMSQRAGFVGLDRETWVSAVLLPTPIIGRIFESIVATVEIKRVMAGSPEGSLAYHGLYKILPEAFAASSNNPLQIINILGYRFGVGQIATYLASIPPVIARGIWGGAGLVALIGIFAIRNMFRFASADGRRSEHLLVILPIYALFVVNTLFTDNTYWLNPLLPFVYAHAIAYVARGW